MAPPEEATRGRNSRETTAGANATEFARNHSGSIETQRNSRNHSGSVETKAPSHPAPRCGRQPKWPPQKRPEEATRGRNSRETTAGANATEFSRNHSGSIETQRNSRETTAGASKPRPRPTARAVAVGNLSGPPMQKRPEEATRGRNSHETTARASKPSVGNLSGPPRRGLKRPLEAGIRAKPQGEHRNATEFAGVSKPRIRPTARARARRCGQQPIPLL